MLSEVNLKPWVWWRFLDDVWFIWLHGEDKLQDFFDYVNSYHSTIKYTWEWSKIELSYLDVKIKLFEGRLCADVHCKKTDTHQYLDYSSCHPRHAKKGIPYGQALRLRVI